jgi:asparagine synthetase A
MGLVDEARKRFRVARALAGWLGGPLTLYDVSAGPGVMYMMQNHRSPNSTNWENKRVVFQTWRWMDLMCCRSKV